MAIEFLQEISNNYNTAVAVHRELADVFWFLGGCTHGYAMWNEYQLIDESLTQRKIKRYITSTYHTFIPDELPKSANIAEPLLNGKNRKTLKMEEMWRIIKEAFRFYREWEEQTLELYQQIAAKLASNGEISAFNFVGEIIKSVKIELDYITDKTIELNSMNWDMAQIVAEQDTLTERYEYLIRNLLGKSHKYHHWNSSTDAISRMTLLDKNPD